MSEKIRSISGTLPVGIEHDGVLLRDVTLRHATVADTIAAIEEAGPDAGSLHLDMAILAQCLTVKGCPEDTVDLDFVMELDEDDGFYLTQLKEELRKKRKAPSEPLSSSESLNSPS